jgi:PleD family two-component response regulator
MDDAADRLAALNITLAETTEHASVTIGLAGMEADDSLQDLIARADEALYQQRR